MKRNDLIIEVTVGSQGTYRIHADSPMGQIHEDLEDVSPSLAITTASLVAAGDVKERSLVEAGERLFKTIFCNGIRDLYYRTIAQQPSRVLRVVIRMDWTEPPLSYLAHVPWELLYDPDHKEFLALNGQHSLIRVLSSPHRRRLTPLKVPLRILLISASPVDMAPLVPRNEGEAISSSLENHPNIQLSVLENPTLNSLRSTLLDIAPHVIHFIGHGAFDRQTGEGKVFLGSTDAVARAVTGGTLGIYLQGIPSVRLVVLNASETGSARPFHATAQFASVASALVARGVPYALAMQAPVTNDDAVTFSNVFYRYLAEGGSVESALIESRLALRALLHSSCGWVAPALFSGYLQVELVSPAATPESGNQEKVSRPALATSVISAGSGISPLPQETHRSKIANNIEAHTSALLRQFETSYEETRKTARVWSWSSVAAASLGLGMVSTAIVTLFLTGVEVGAITGLLGATSGTVSALFFRQWRLASGRLAAMVVGLEDLKRLDYAHQIARTLETPGERDRAKSAIIQGLIEKF